MFLGLIQPDVAITDFLLCIEALTFAFLLHRKETKNKHLKNLSVLFFLSLALSSILGAFVHGYFPTPDSVWNNILWRATLLTVGIISLFTWLIAFNVLTKKHLKIIFTFVILDFFVYAYYILFVNPQFKIAIYNYLPAVVFLLLVFCILKFRKKQQGVIYGIIGLIATFLAAIVQQSGLSIHPIYFNHNALYHLIQAVAILLLFITFRRLLLWRLK